MRTGLILLYCSPAQIFTHHSPSPRISFPKRGEGWAVHEHIRERCIRIGQYIADTGATVRGAAGHFGVSKSSVHKDMDERLPKINRLLYRQVRGVLSYNKAVRHLRGGEATRQKYLGG